jgi:hypothetical protein
VLARIALLALAMLPMAAGTVELIGKTMPPYPPGLRDVGGSCLSESADPAHVCDYSIGLLGDADANPEAEPSPRYVVAGRMAGREGPLALWKITDAQAYPKVGKGYYWQAGSCRVDQADDAKVIAVVQQSSDQEYLTDIAWARRLDLTTGKFSAIDPKRVDCINEGYGEP